jgi:acyl dehydratase
MPIHADPDIAQGAGFDRPISHGLNTFGLAFRAALKHFAPKRLTSMAVRFVAPCPGDTIIVELFHLSDGLRFRAYAEERQKLVLDRGEIKLECGASPKDAA